MEIPADLLKKYDLPVPRYTSYPPANRFTTDFGEADYTTMITESNKALPRHIAFYIHIPFCRSTCLYCGCNSNALGDGNLVQPYMEALFAEIDRVTGLIDRNRRISQIHYGGGTPNAIDLKWLGRINEYLGRRFSFIENPEIAIECHPAWLNEESIGTLKTAGFNRFSIGVQDLNPEIIRPLNRELPAMELSDMMKLIRSGNRHTGINLDFIYGLPGQTVDGFSDTIRKAIELRPDRLVTFSYAHVPWLKKNQVRLEKLGLPAAEDKLRMFHTANKLLRKSGYRFLGMDHYVLPGDELDRAFANHELQRNFQGYCTRRTTGQVYAFGASAISQLDGGYSQNTKDPDEYLASVRNGRLPVERGYRVTAEQKIIRKVIQELMCNKRINWNELLSESGINEEELDCIKNIRSRDISHLFADGLVQATGDELLLTDTGSFFIRNVAAALDPAFTGQPFTYSRSV